MEFLTLEEMAIAEQKKKKKPQKNKALGWKK